MGPLASHDDAKTAPVRSIMSYDHFTVTRHFIYPDPQEKSFVKLLGKTEDQITVFHNKRTIVASYVGTDEYLLAYDFNPFMAYKFDGNEFFPDPNGNYHIEKFGLDYFIKETGLRVYLGPWYHFFYDKPALGLDKIANLGQFLMTHHMVFRCLTCEGHIPEQLLKAKYCSVECGLRTRGIVAMENRQRNQPRDINCHGCGTVFVAQGGGNHRYCETCNTKEPRKLICEKCSNTFTAVGSGNHKFCSDCKTTTKPNIQCGHCRVSFKPSGNQRYCSKRCKYGIGPRFPVPDRWSNGI